MAINEFLISTNARLQGLRATRDKYASQFAPEFNLIGLLDPNEVKLSVLLRELLDPCGSHAQGRRFLDAFIEQLNLPEWTRKRKVFSVSNEVCTDSIERINRRIDILIELTDQTGNQKFAIGIENKPWASDGELQITHYLEHMSKRYKDGYLLIYLSGYKDSLPATSSISEDDLKSGIDAKHIFINCFEDLLPWLVACRSSCEAPTVHAFIKSFEKYITQTFLGVKDMLEHNQLIEDATRTPETVEISLALSLAQADIKAHLIKKLENELLQGIEISNCGWHLLKSEDIFSNHYSGFMFQLERGDQYTVCFECEYKGGGNFYYGICKNLEGDEDLLDVSEALLQAFAKGKRSTWWPWVQPFASNLADWRYTTEPWVQIASGEMSKWMLETVKHIEDVLVEKKLKHRLTGSGARLP
jgi:hypothetical protein